MKSYKLRLKLSKEQERLAWDYAYTSHRYWNVLVDVDKRNNKGEFDTILQERGNKTYYSEFHERDVYKLNASDYRYLAQFVIAEAYSEDEEQWSWYYRPNQTFIYNTLARDVVKIRYLNKGKLNFRSVGKHTPSFSVRCDACPKRVSRIYLKESGWLQVPTLGDIKLGSVRKDINLSCKKQTAKVSFDGKYWYLSYSEKIETTVVDLPDYTEGLGIDLGVKTLATISDGTAVPNIKTFRRVRILNKRLKRLQRKVSRKYLINKCTKHTKTKNILKLEKQIRLIHRSIKNIRINHIRKFVSNLVKKQPQYIAIEDLNVKGMMKNKHLAKDIANCSFYTIREHLIRKAKERHIAIRLVERFYPSSKTCSSCGSYKKDLKLSDRTYSCTACGSVLDRDVNASLNIAYTDNYKLA